MSAIIKLKHYINQDGIRISQAEKNRLLNEIDRLVMEEMNEVKFIDRIENNCIIIKSKI